MGNPLELKFSFKTGDKGLGNLFRVLANAGGKVKVGVVGPKALSPKKPGTGQNPENATSLTVAAIAAIHELGIGVQARPFISGWVDKNKAGIKADIRKAVKLISIGRTTPENALKILGVKWVAEVQEYITNPSNFATLKPATLARKAPKANPLIDTGQLRSSVTYELVKV